MEEFALTYWTWKEVQEIYSDWSEKQCREFLQRNEEHIRRITKAAGWEAIRFCVKEENRWKE